MAKAAREPRARLFVALELPEECGSAAALARDAFGPVDELRLVRGESLHVTLVFWAITPSARIERIAAIAFDEPAGPFDLVPEAVVPVPHRRPRLYALGLEDAGGGLHGWQEGCHCASKRRGCTSPRSGRSGPVTLARVKRGVRVPTGLALPGAPSGLRPAVPREPGDALQVDAEAERRGVRAARHHRGLTERQDQCYGRRIATPPSRWGKPGERHD